MSKKKPDIKDLSGTIKSFNPNEFERTLAEYFVRTHKHSWLFRKLIYDGPIHFHYKRENTGIGRGISVICCECGKELDVTDYDSW